MAREKTKILSLARPFICKRYFRNSSNNNHVFHNKFYRFHLNEEVKITDTKDILLDPDLSYSTITKTLLRQANKSVLLQVFVPPNLNDEYMNEKLLKLVSEIGNCAHLERAYSKKSSESRYYFVEFEDVMHTKKLLQPTKLGVPLRIANLKPNLKNTSPSNFDDDVVKSKSEIKDLKDDFRECEDMSSQMDLLYQKFSSSSNNLRAKFFLTSLMDDFFSHLISPSFAAIPFGTSMSGFGKMTSDIDISVADLRFGNEVHSIRSLRDVTRAAADDYKNHHREGSLKLFSQSNKLITDFLPMISNAKMVPAQIPLMSFYFKPLDISADISLDNRSGVQMGWCINMYVRMDERVGPYLFLIREWAKQNKIVKHGDKTYDGLTPFMLTSLALFYLMRLNPAVIPPLFKLIYKYNGHDDWIMGGFRTKLVRQIKNVKLHGNEMSVEELFVGFLNYYRAVDFSRTLFSLTKGESGVNRRNQYLAISSPLQSLQGQIGKNCSVEKLHGFQKQLDITLLKLEDRSKKDAGYKDWGILSIIDMCKV